MVNFIGSENIEKNSKSPQYLDIIEKMLQVYQNITIRDADTIGLYRQMNNSAFAVSNIRIWKNC